MAKILPFEECAKCLNCTNNVCKYVDDKETIDMVNQIKNKIEYPYPFHISCTAYIPPNNYGYNCGV